MTDVDPVRELLSRLPGHRQAGEGKYIAKCPAHDDGSPSLTIARGDDGRALVNCHAGCTPQAICAAVGMTLSQLFAPKDRPRMNGNHNGHAGAGGAKPKPKPNAQQGKVVAVYDYVDAEGDVLYQKVRYEPKNFSQRRPLPNGGYTFTLGDVQRVLYRQPELNDADFDALVYFVEGEKAVDRLRAEGLVSTCTCDGAGKWRDEYTEGFRDRHVAILADNDDAGRNHAEMAAGKLAGVAASVRIVQLPGLPEKGDAFDYLSAGHSAAELTSVAMSTPLHGQAANALTIRCVTELLEAHPTQRPPIIRGLIREGDTLNLVSGPKTFKSHTVMSLILCVVFGRLWLDTFEVKQGRVLLLDNELYGDTIADRVRAVAAGMGIDPADAAGRFDVVSLRGNLQSLLELESFFRSIEPGKYTLICIDAMYRFLPPEEGAENSNAIMTSIYNTLDRHAMRLRCGFIVVHHTSKGVQGAKSITDVGAGAGAQSRAADAHMVIRPHQEDGCVVIEAEVRTFRKPDPVTLRWDYPVWRVDTTLDPNLLQTERGRGGRPRKEEQVTTKPERITYTPETFTTAFVTAEAKPAKLIEAKAVSAGLAKSTANTLLLLAADMKLVHRHAKKGDNKTYFATSEPTLLDDVCVSPRPPVPPMGKRRRKRRSPGK